MRRANSQALICVSFREESGYSMVEVMAAIMILSITIIPMVGMFDAGLRAAVLGSNYDKGRALANEKLEEIKAQDYSEVAAQHPPGSPGACPPSPSAYAPFGCTIETTYAELGTAEIKSNSSARTMMRVDVKVTWGSSGKYTTSGLVAK